jgi:hypothetical protein
MPQFVKKTSPMYIYLRSFDPYISAIYCKIDASNGNVIAFVSFILKRNLDNHSLMVYKERVAFGGDQKLISHKLK